tara:strand:- start:204 stop:887 length:684 start_codon:yes stop_codon:yes gene_type:complete
MSNISELSEVSDQELLEQSDGEISISEENNSGSNFDQDEEAMNSDSDDSITDPENYEKSDLKDSDDDEDPWIEETEFIENKQDVDNIELSTSSESEQSEIDEEELKKIEKTNDTNILINYHPEIQQINYKELTALSKITRNKNGQIIDPLHKTLPLLTRYEKAKILGVRAKQINNGSKLFINVGKDVIEGHTIALMELEQKKIPFIIRRPLPNGKSEYWRVKDLEML